MTRRNRQGWRVLIVLSRLAVAGLLLSGSPLAEPHTVFGQANPDPSPDPPPPPTLRSSEPFPTESPPKVSKHQPIPNHPAATPDNDEPTPATRPSDPTSFPLTLPTPPSLERLTARRISLNQILYRDRRHQLLLSRGDQAISGGHYGDALSNFEALFEATHDAFFWPDDSANPCGAQFALHRRLQSLPMTVREEYEHRHGDEACALLAIANESGEPAHVFDLLRRFSHTSAGREALCHELISAVDTGHLMLAEDLSRRLAADPYHWQQLSDPLKNLIRRINDRCLESVASSSAEVPVSPPALLPIWSYQFAHSLPAAEEVQGGAPLASLSSSVADSLQEWLDDRRERRFPVATANHSLVVDDLVFIRDFTGVRALRMGDGNTAWTYTCIGSLAATAAESLHEEARGGGAPPLNFQAHFAGHGPRGQLSTNGRLLYLLDHNPSPMTTSDSERSDGEKSLTNRLVALPLRTDAPAPEPVWIRGDGDLKGADSLAGHFFLGPPLPVDRRLFVLTEHDGRLDCLALDASDGRLLWRQPIALTEQPIDWDTSRLRIACTPLAAGSVIVCPTEVGVVVGIDSLTGMLRWVYDHIDDDQRLAAGRWSSSSQRSFGSTELPSRTLLYQGRIYHLPFRSRSLHCIDAATGAGWKVERSGALAVTCVTNDAVILIGLREVMAFSAHDGSLLWKTPCPEPAGHGLVAGDQYLLPTADGRCLSIALADGALMGSRFAAMLHEMARPETHESESQSNEILLVSHTSTSARSANLITAAGGNLLAAGEAIVMTTPTHVSVISQARPLLDQLHQASHSGPLSDEERLQSAMLQLLLDERFAARASLEQLAGQASVRDVQQRAAHLLREILFAELADTDAPQPILDRLHQLAVGDRSRLRLLVATIDAELKLRDSASLVQSIDQLRTVQARERIHPDGDAAYAVRAMDYVADQLAQLRAAGDREVARTIGEYLVSAVTAAASSGDVAELEQLVTLFDAWPQVAGLRNEIATASIAAGQLQQAELMLLKNRDEPDAGARACRLLSELYVSQGLHREAAANLIELMTTYRDADVGDGMTGGSFVNTFSSENLAWTVVGRRSAAPLPVNHVRIREHICGEGCEHAESCRSTIALENHDRIRRKFLTDGGSSVTVIDRGIVSADRSQSRLALVNRETGQLQGQLDVPAAYWQLAGAGDGCCGQLLPICGRAAHGLSLLEQRSVWSTVERGDERAQDKVKVGPVGYDFCVLQTSRRLSVIHPATGETRWFRDDLPPNVGLMANETTGIIGDAQTLTLFDSDQQSYTIYRMRSGRLVRQGRLHVADMDSRRYQRGVGASLVYVVSNDDGERLRYWDATSDRLLLDEPLFGRLFCALDDGQRYAYVNREHRLRIAGVSSGCYELDLPLPQELLENVSDMNVSHDPENYFVNFVKCDTESTDDAVAATDEVELPCLRVNGELLAVSRNGEVRWTQPVSDAALLAQPDCCLPILTLVSRVRDPHHRQSATLRVSILDARTGHLVAQRDDLLRTRIVQSDYRPRAGRLTLVGLDSQIDVDFGPSPNDMLIQAEVDQAEPLVR